jgi:tetratricopeptide (TPR) repeat protein
MRQAFRAGRHVCLHGLGGLGKTTLAEAFAHNYDNHSHTIVIFRNGNQINEAHILHTLNKRFAKTNPDLAEQIQQAIDDPQTDVLHKLQLLIDNYLHGRKTILIFDNVEDVQTDKDGAFQRSIGSDSLSAFLRHLCENTPQNCHMLFTTRYKIANLADVVEHLALDKMGYAEQYRLLNYSQILRDIPLRDRDDVYKRLDGHPRGYEYLEVLLKKDKTFRRQQVSAAEADVFENLLLAKVYERLTEREKAIFQIVTVFIARTPLEGLAAVSGEKEADLWPVLQSLQDWSLCFLQKDGRFEVHRLTREWMSAHVISDVKVKEYALKAGEYFEAQPTWDDKVLAKDYFEIAEDWQQFAITSFSIQDYYQLIGLYPQAFELNQAVLDKSIEEQFISIALFNMGAIFNLFSQDDQALTLYEKSLAINKKIGDRKGEGATLNNISQIFSAKGDYDTALRYLEQSLAIMQQIGDRKGEGVTLNNIGQIHKARGNYDEALRCAEMDLAICQQIGDRKGEGATLNNISQIYDAKSDYDTALRYLEQSLAITQQIGDRLGEGTTFNNIGQIHQLRGDYDTALRYYEQSLTIMQQIGDIYGMAGTLHNMGGILFERNDFEGAAPYFIQAYQIFYQIGSPNAKVPKSYLQSIIERIGEAKYQEIIAKME